MKVYRDQLAVKPETVTPAAHEKANIPRERRTTSDAEKSGPKQ